MAEQESGKFDFKIMYKATKLRPPRTDAVTDKGPVEVRETAGRGRGLFTTRAVKAGEIMLCEKAFSYCFAASLEEIAKTAWSNLPQTSYLIDIARNRITHGTHADLIRVTSSKLVLNRSLQSNFKDLYSGDYKGATNASAGGNSVVDTFLVARTIHLNCFGCPLTSKHMIEDPNAYGKNKLQTTGLWITASYINHSCDSTCSRSFIGDMQIVRAARDMPAGTELTFSYITRDEPVAMNKILKEGWDFECDCCICEDDRATSSTVKAQRAKLIKSFHALNASSKRKMDIIAQLNRTYQLPPIQVPRFEMWNLHFSLVVGSAKKGQPEKVVEHVLAAFESVGLVIEGARITPVPDKKLIVKKWGAPHIGATSAFLSLRNVYKLFEKTELAEQTKEYTRISWMLIAGDDTTFVYDNPPKK